MVRRAKSLRERRHIDKAYYRGSSELFYEPNYPHYHPSDELKSSVDSLIAARGASWRTHRTDVWTHVIPFFNGVPVNLPNQGWKIHVSATESNCRDILNKVSELAFEHNVHFKFANDVNTLKLMTSKRWPRGGSGKFITLYPCTEKFFREFIEYAYEILKDDVGSYILSDRRYKDCRCLYYRYGGFNLSSRLHFMGTKIHMLTSPDGDEVEDRRTPYYESPSWAPDPFPQEELDEGEMTLNDGRYEVKSALGFSNTGGVYLAIDTVTGKEVVIKEARPYVELGANGADATTRLAKEENNLRALTGLGIAPEVYTSFQDWENHYLVEEYFDAFDIRELTVMKSPLVLAYPTLADSKAFYESYKNIFIGVLNAVDQIHAKGMIIGDLSPTNILIEKTTMSVRIIDLEGAYRPSIEDAETLFTPGFRSEHKGRPKESNFHDDLYAIGTMMLYGIFPIAAMAYLRADLFTKIAPIVLADIGWSQTPVQHVIEQLITNSITCREAIELLNGRSIIEQPMTRKAAPAVLPLEEICRGMARFINSNFRLDAPYTLFPIDPFGSSFNPISLGFGSSGIIHSLLKCGFETPGPALQRYQNEIDAIDPKKLAPGFWIGAAGIAWTLLSTEKLEDGKKFLLAANSSPLLREHHSLYYGMAGIGMTNLAAFRMLDAQHYLNVAIDLAETLAATALTSERGIYWNDDVETRIGFGYGQSGVALFFLRLYQMTNVPKWHALGKKALEYDLSFCFEREPGVGCFPCAPDETNTYDNYIEQGSAGIAKVAIRYGLWSEIDNILADAHRKYAVFAGLSYGVIGFVDVLLDAYLYSQDKKYLDMAERPLQGFRDIFLFESGDGYAVPGDGLFRISCDYATGIAGVMKTLHRWSNLLPDEFCLDELDNLSGHSATKRTLLK
ncbi:class III lanthionine synthetase LanKC [Janthinobacterium fluminis]|nr:class III lanthionine synthetase LanKC [Janthinobacterium fluminis]